MAIATLEKFQIDSSEGGFGGQSICDEVRNLASSDPTDSLTSLGNCRSTATAILDYLQINHPEISAYPLKSPGSNPATDHYAVGFETGNELYIINLVKAAGFNIYLGEMKTAHPILASMEKVEMIT